LLPARQISDLQITDLQLDDLQITERQKILRRPAASVDVRVKMRARALAGGGLGSVWGRVFLCTISIWVGSI
jgi:hypothetical protein